MNSKHHLALAFTQIELDSAYSWLCQQRKYHPPNADIWSFRFNWAVDQSSLFCDLNEGRYRFSPLKRLTKANGQTIHLWCSQDALVMKLLAVRLAVHLKIPMSCTHLQGHGGLKQSVCRVQGQLKHYQFVCKTDVKQFYESIDQSILMDQIDQHITCRTTRYYLCQVIRRTVEYGGLYRDIRQGISRGCPLSPLFGALYLKELDQQFDGKGLFYLRYMDDILILSHTRWQNRRAVKALNQCFNRLKVKQHPDKTFIGKIDRGFDFLGYHFSRSALTLASNTVKQHVACIYRLYEQQRNKKATPEEVAFALDEYVKRWRRWCSAGLGELRFSSVYDGLRLDRTGPEP